MNESIMGIDIGTPALYKYIIVDDESIIRQGIIKKISKLNMPLVCVGQAENGIDGLRLIESQKPDIIISDMKMPEMNGMEFLSKCNERYPEKQIIVLSSYKDFEYINTALEHSAVGYVLKPFSPEEMQKLLNKAIERIEKAQSLSTQVDTMQERIGQLEQRIHNRRWLGRLLHPPGDKDEEKPDLRKAALISIRSNNYTLLQHLEELCHKPRQGVNLFAVENSAMKNEYFVLAVEDVGGYDAVSDCADAIANELKDTSGVIYMSIGSDFNAGVSNLHQLYLDNRELLMQVRISWQSCVLKKPVKRMQRVHSDESIQDLFLSMRYDIDAIPGLLKGFFGRLEQADATFAVLFTECNRLLALVNEYAMQNAVEINEIMDVFEQRYFCDTNLTRAEREITGYIKLVFCSLQSSSSSQLVQLEKIKAYLDKNYSGKITLETISKEFYLNPSYCSYLFKLKTQESFNEYLTRVRMEKAKKLLKETRISVEHISGEIGYRNPKYFFNLFKKQTGLTPIEYRSKHT